MAWYKIVLPGFPAPGEPDLADDVVALASCPALGAVSLLAEPEAVNAKSVYYFYAEKPDEVGWFTERYSAQRCRWPDTEKLREIARSEGP